MGRTGWTITTGNSRDDDRESTVAVADLSVARADYFANRISVRSAPRSDRALDWNIFCRLVYRRAVQLLGQLFAACVPAPFAWHGRKLRGQHWRANDRHIV